MAKHRRQFLACWTFAAEIVKIRLSGNRGLFHALFWVVPDTLE